MTRRAAITCRGVKSGSRVTSPSTTRRCWRRNRKNCCCSATCKATWCSRSCAAWPPRPRNRFRSSPPQKMQLRAEELERHLSRSLVALYVIHGDEPLQSLEAADAIRAAGREKGYAEREVLAVERGFDWNQLRISSASLSLFSPKKLIELRISGGKPVTEGAVAIEQHCSAPAP